MEIYIDEVTRSSLEELETAFSFKETLASGSFGTVIRATQISNNKEVAIKILKKSIRKANTSKIKQEISILKQLNHPNIIECFGYTETNSKLYIIMEYIAYGTLKNWIDQHKGPITEPEASVILEKLISAVAYLHSKEVCHRDIKPDNIMFNNKDDLTSLKLIDFGLSAENFDGFEEHDYCGTFIYMAPEQIEKKLYSKFVDLWSIGIIMFLLLNNGRHPFYVQGDHKRSYIEKIRKAKLMMYNQISEMGEKLLRALLDPNPNLRIKAKNALCHPWVTRRMYDPLPLNFFESLTYVNIVKKMKQAMILSIFSNNISKEKHKAKFIITDNYIKSIEQENRFKRESFKRQRENSFEVVVMQRKNSFQDTNSNYSHNYNYNTTQSLLVTPVKAKISKSMTKANNNTSSTYNNNNSIKRDNNNNEENKENSIVNNSSSHYPLQSSKKTYGNGITSVNSLTNRLNRKNSFIKANGINNQKKIHSTSLNSTRIMVNQNESPSRLRGVVLPKIVRDPFIGATSFPQSLRENIVHRPIDNSLSPSRNYQLQTPIKIKSEIKHECKVKNGEYNNNKGNNELNMAKMLKPVEGSAPSQAQIKVNQINLKNVNSRQLYLPSINSASPKKKGKVN